MRGRALLVVSGALVALAIVQPSAGSRLKSSSRPRARTIATIRGPIGQFAESSRYLAWLTPPTSPFAKPDKSACVVKLTFRDLRTGKPSSVRGYGAGDLLDECEYPADSMAL